MHRLLFALAGLVLGLALGFVLFSSSTPDAPEVVAAPRANDRAAADAPAPLPATEARAEPPASAPVETERTAEPTAPPPADAALVPDATIRGIVVDTAGRPVPYARVSADIENAAPDEDAPQGMFFDFNQAAPRHVETRATSGGRFALGGLLPGAQHLVRTQYSRGLRADIGRDWEIDDRHLTAPSDNVRLTYSQGVLEIELVPPEPRDRIENCGLEIGGDGVETWRDNGDSATKFKVGVPVGRRLRVAVEARGFQPAAQDGVVVEASEAAKRIAIPLVPRGSGFVRLVVRDDLGRPQKDVVLDDVTDRKRISSVNVDWKRSSPDLGTFVLTDLPAGVRVLRARGSTESELVPGEAQVQVLEAGESNASIVLVRGGRLRVTVTSGGETFVQARIFDGEQRVDGSFRDERSRQDVGDQLVSGQRYLFESGLAPGKHVLRWEQGRMGHFGNVAFRSLGSGLSQDVPFTVTAGEVTDLSIDL